MSEKNTPKSGKPKAASKAGQSRDDRLKAALKANLGRRKAQARARAVVDGGDEDKSAQ